MDKEAKGAWLIRHSHQIQVTTNQDIGPRAEIASWSKVSAPMFDAPGRIGNDSEVCWTTYACAQLGSPIGIAAAENIIRNCGALSVLSSLNCTYKGLVDKSIFAVAYDRMRVESANGSFWPVLMEWRARKWPRYAELKIENESKAEKQADECSQGTARTAATCLIDRTPAIDHIAAVPAGRVRQRQLIRCRQLSLKRLHPAQHLRLLRYLQFPRRR